MTKIFILLLSIAVFVSASPAGAASTDDEVKTDRLLFASSIDEFITAREEGMSTGSTLDFESDGCSKVADKPMGFDFLPSCQRHDFGYRNYKQQGRRDDTARKRIDRNFRKDMWDACANVDNTILEYTYPLAELVAEAVNGIEELLNFSEGNTHNEGQGGYYNDYYNYDGYYDNSDYYYDTYGEEYYDGSYYDNYGSYDSVESNYNNGQGSYGSGGDDGYSYSERIICEVIADTYYYGVTINGMINGVPRRYGTGEKGYFWGMYGFFLSALVFGYGLW